MALELRQQLKLSQQLTMTPQLQQAIKLLQLSRLELADMVQQEMLENPCLEEKPEEPEQDGYEERVEAPAGESAENDDIYDKEVARNADWEDYLGDFASTSRQASLRESELPEDSNIFENSYSTRASLEGHLLWQLYLSPLSGKEQEIGEAIINNLGSNGYLQSSIEDVAGIAGCSAGRAESVLKKVQLFDPVGVAARTPQECLLVQMEVLHYDRDPILVSLVRDHLEDLQERRYKPIMRKFKLTQEDFREYLDIIQTLDPMPGASYGDVEPHYVEPDVYVYKHEGEFLVVLNEEGIPQLQLSSLYAGSLGAMRNGRDKEYLQEKFNSARWLIKSLHQRQRTLYKVMESIVRHQQDFFEFGPSRLKPLILKEIAEDVGMHESTISRVTTNKYAATPHGLFELKFFFNSSLALSDGNEVGSESVKILIKKYIAEEDAKAPLSDEKIVNMLKEALGVNIARRTVAKYRTALGIDSSSRRREML
ncbi:MAG: RNA polymerase factor sigma-54 [Deltaproteobacteria bacterium]|jgi:RNA polymerase sigma-54 factor|nr:RNA polymerase factor sigma-54 [Deltaproteobacteria bacterium]